MKGFDDHLDNYGDPDPGDNDNLIREGIYAANDEGNPDDHPPTYEEDPGFYDDSLYPECEHTPPCTGDREDAPCYTSESETAEILADPATMAAIEEGENDADWVARLESEVEEARQDDGITSDDFDNWPRERGFPS